MPVYNEESGIVEAYERLNETMARMSLQWELLCVDDGSTDQSYRLLCAVANRDERVKVIRFSRNFGVPAAHSAAFQVASGDIALIISADLQEPIEMLPAFIQKWQEGFAVVWGVKATADAPLFAKVTSHVFFGLYRWLGGLDRLPSDFGWYMVDRSVIQALRLFPERNRWIAGLIAWLGFPQAQIPCHFSARQHGRSKWSLPKRLRMAVDAFVGFSYAPIRSVSLIGFFLSFLSFVYGLVVSVLAITQKVEVQGWPTMMVTLLFLSGVQLLVTGMIGEYIWRTLDESRRRPAFVVMDALGFSETDTAKLGAQPRTNRNDKEIATDD